MAFPLRTSPSTKTIDATKVEEENQSQKPLHQDETTSAEDEVTAIF